MIFQIEDQKPTEEEILEFQKKFSVELPKDYLEFLKKCNGGELDPEAECEEEGMVLLQQAEEYCTPDVFFGLGETHSGCTNLAWPLENFEGELPSGLIVIANTLEDGYIVLNCNQSGEVTCYDHTSTYEATQETGNSVYYIAPNFTAFMEMLGPMEFTTAPLEDAK